jgi:hypothetical protein
MPRTDSNGYLTEHDVACYLPDEDVIRVMWVNHGRACTELATELWARAHIMELVHSPGIELAGANASRAFWGMRSYDPIRGWLYIETRRKPRKVGKGA